MKDNSLLIRIVLVVLLSNLFLGCNEDLPLDEQKFATEAELDNWIISHQLIDYLDEPETIPFQ